MLHAYLQFQSFKDSGCIDNSGVPTLQCFEVVFNNVILIATWLVILILFVMIVIGAFKYLTSRGNPEAMTSARNTIMYAVLGLVLFMMSYLIINIVQLLFIGDPETEDVPSLLKFEIPDFKPGE
jgi:hypothetical protein